MKHVTKIIESKDANGQIAVLIRCCDEPRTDQWHTVAASSVANGFAAQRFSTAKAHNDVLLAQKHLSDIKEDAQEHEL